MRAAPHTALGQRRIVDMYRLRPILVLAVLTPTFSACAQSLPDFSGTWRVAEARNSTPNSGDAPLRRRGFTFTIAQDRTELRILFPKLPALVFKVDGSENRYLHDSGDAWTKFTTVAKWDGALLTLKSTTLNGWWKTSSPESTDSQPTQLEETRILRFEASGARLKMDTSSHDEKPFLVQYVDVLVRVEP